MKLKFTPHKTYAIIITRRLKYDLLRLSIGGIDIEVSNEIKILGLTIDHKLSFHTYVTNVCKKARSCRNSCGAPYTIYILYYQQLVRGGEKKGLASEKNRMWYSADSLKSCVKAIGRPLCTRRWSWQVCLPLDL